MLYKQQYLWIATPFDLRQPQRVFRTMEELKSAGFDRGDACAAANGNRRQHKKHLFRREPRTIGKAALIKACGQEIVRALMLGENPDPRGRMSAPIAARCIETGEVTLHYSRFSLESAGFDRRHVYGVLAGKSKFHRGHVFYRVSPEVWKNEAYCSEGASDE
ncbi:hypothetical protein NUL63_004563 [Salmonella enterica]|nr:hypothetical protein [Salmonella enterica]